MSSSTAQWQRWWPLPVAVFLTALSFVIQPAPVRGLPPVMVAFVAILVFGGVWGLLAGAVWWCRRHPRSIDHRTENRSA